MSKNMYKIRSVKEKEQLCGLLQLFSSDCRPMSKDRTLWNLGYKRKV